MREYLLTASLAAAVTYLLTPFVRRLAVRIGAFTEVRERDVHTVPTPRMGGLAIFGGLLGGLLVASRLPALEQVFRTSDAVGVIEGGLVLVLIGVADDRWGLDALTKLAGQILAAGLMVLQGVQLLYLPIPGSGVLSLTPDIGVPLTVLFVIITINAVNFIDGLDGLAAGVVAIAAMAFFAYSYELSVTYGIERANAPTLLTAVLAGACVGFLPHNFNPARIFMGDTGSMLLGLVLSAATVSLIGQQDPTVYGGSDEPLFPTLLPLLLPVAVLMVPMIDLLLAVIRRTRGRQAPWTPDKRHLHHRLLMLGHSHARAVLLMYLWTGLIAGAAVSVAFSNNRPLIGLAAFGGGAAILLVASSIPLLRAGRRS
jgi:UDP-GlcNAc:undecaprenyl-phosphate GlcNAc-1-phosphate transferase